MTVGDVRAAGAVAESAPGALERREVQFAGHPVTGFVQEGLTPLAARGGNLNWVVQVLEAAGVDWFAVRGFDDLSATIGVLEDDRERVFDALQAFCQETPGYVASREPLPKTVSAPMPGDAPATWRRVKSSRVIRLTWFRCDPSASLTCGVGHGCDIEFWYREERHEEDVFVPQPGVAAAPQRLVAPRANRVARVIDADAEPVSAPGARFSRIASPTRSQLPEVRTRQEFLPMLPEDIDFPVDVVYTWVDGNDPAWQRRRAEARGEGYHEESASVSRFISRDELRYSLRSLHMNAPWVRNIYLVTDDQVPSWLDTSVAGLRVVSHKEIFSDPSVLPTFNSHAIESQLHHIEGLAEHFLYFNDDMFIGRPVGPQLFFTPQGIARHFPSGSRVPGGPITVVDTPVDAATKNNRRLLEERFGRSITQVMEHVPYAMRRSVLEELEREHPEVFAITRANQFRSLADHNIPSNLAQYYGLFTGRSTPASVNFAYVGLAVKDLRERLARLLARRDRDAFCINDTFSAEEDIEAQNAVVAPFLEAYFPVPSPYEKSAGAQ